MMLAWGSEAGRAKPAEAPGETSAVSPPPSPARSRFALSAWALVRSRGDRGNLAPGGILGGSQVGARAIWEPGPRGIGLTARLSSPLASRFGNEASVGIALRRGSIGLLVEERIALDGLGGARPSVTAFGGVSDVRLIGRLTVDGYAQAGVVGLRNRVGFADGAVRVEHPLSGRAVRLAAGASLSGGAQPGLARLDAGPLVALSVPVAGGSLRIAGEWRFRVAGNAAPGSGPVLTMGADF